MPASQPTSNSLYGEEATVIWTFVLTPGCNVVDINLQISPESSTDGLFATKEKDPIPLHLTAVIICHLTMLVKKISAAAGA